MLRLSFIDRTGPNKFTPSNVGLNLILILFFFQTPDATRVDQYGYVFNIRTSISLYIGVLFTICYYYYLYVPSFLMTVLQQILSSSSIPFVFV
jgi:hypothetical protein